MGKDRPSKQLSCVNCNAMPEGSKSHSDEVLLYVNIHIKFVSFANEAKCSSQPSGLVLGHVSG